MLGGRIHRLVATLATATLALAGCGSEDAETASTQTSADGDFPVTIESALGSATIEEPPERVVTIGQGSADTAVALGVVPVGVEEDLWGGDEDGYQPWLRAAVEEQGEELPTTFTVQPDIDMDAIVELAPDLILAPQSGLTQDQFDVLNDLAPTVAYPGDPWSTPWDTQIELIGQALGAEDEATQLIDEIETTFADAAADNPEFDGVTFAYLYSGEPGRLGVFQPEEPRATYLMKLGLDITPVVEDLPKSEGSASSEVGLEQADLFHDVDLVFSWFSDAEQQETIESQPLYADIPAVERGSYVVSYDRQFVTATSLITPLSVPWALDEYIDRIQDAIDQL